MDLTNEKVAETSVDLRVGNVDHILVDVKVDLKQRNQRLNLKFQFSLLDHSCNCKYSHDKNTVQIAVCFIFKWFSI